MSSSYVTYYYERILRSKQKITKTPNKKGIQDINKPNLEEFLLTFMYQFTPHKANKINNLKPDNIRLLYRCLLLFTRLNLVFYVDAFLSARHSAVTERQLCETKNKHSMSNIIIQCNSFTYII